jgi:hypothetical protein
MSKVLVKTRMGTGDVDNQNGCPLIEVRHDGSPVRTKGHQAAWILYTNKNSSDQDDSPKWGTLFYYVTVW